MNLLKRVCSAKKLRFVSGMVVLGCMFSCGNQKKSVVTFPVPVEVAKVQSMYYIENSFAGVVKASEMSNLAFKTGGQLIKFDINAGDKISKGQFIGEVDPNDYRLKTEAAKAIYIKSKSQLERFTSLVSRGAISRQEYEAVEAAYVNDKSNYENALSMLNDTKLYAPFTGVVETTFVDNYQRVQPSEPVLTLVNPNELEMTFTLSESLVTLMSEPNKHFYVKFETYPNQIFRAKLVRFVNSSMGGGYPVTVKIDDDRFSTDKYLVKPGFSCTVSVEVKNEEYKNLVRVPATAVGEDMASKTNFVWVYNSITNTVEKRTVTTEGLYGSADLIIAKGLTADETVVTAGIYSLRNGEKVKQVNPNQQI